MPDPDIFTYESAEKYLKEHRADVSFRPNCVEIETDDDYVAEDTFPEAYRTLRSEPENDHLSTLSDRELLDRLTDTYVRWASETSKPLSQREGVTKQDEELYDEILRRMDSGWVSVERELPEPGETVIAYGESPYEGGYDGVFPAYWSQGNHIVDAVHTQGPYPKEGSRGWRHISEEPILVSHWRDLPEPPTESHE